MIKPSKFTPSLRIDRRVGQVSGASSGHPSRRGVRTAIRIRATSETATHPHPSDHPLRRSAPARRAACPLASAFARRPRGVRPTACCPTATRAANGLRLPCGAAIKHFTLDTHVPRVLYTVLSGRLTAKTVFVPGRSSTKTASACPFTCGKRGVRSPVERSTSAKLAQSHLQPHKGHPHDHAPLR